VKLNQSIPVVKYMQRVKEKKTKNLLDTMGDVPVPPEPEEEEDQDQQVYSHFKKELYLNLIYDPASYKVS